MVATKSERSKYWFVRVDGPKEFLTSKCVELGSAIDIFAILAAYHTGKSKENPHCHFVVELKYEKDQEGPQKQSFADRIKKVFGITNKNQYSLQKWDGVRGAGAVSYLFHEEDVSILVNKGFTDEDISAAKLANDAVQKVVNVNAERASGKLVQRALEHFKNGGTRHEILVFMLKEIKEGNSYHPGMYRLKTFVEEVELKLKSPDELEEYAWDLEKNLWR